MIGVYLDELPVWLGAIDAHLKDKRAWLGSPDVFSVQRGLEPFLASKSPKVKRASALSCCRYCW